MQKTISKILVLLALFITVSCGSDKPWVGDWVADSGTDDYVVKIKSNGTIIYDQKSDDGTLYVKGKWTEVAGSENQFTIQFDASTIDVDIDNPLGEMLLQQMAEAMCSQPINAEVSDDGKYMSFGGNGGFVRK